MPLSSCFPIEASAKPNEPEELRELTEEQEI